MKVCYYDTEMQKGARSIFLAGPTVRMSQLESWKGDFWRKDALKILEELGFDGIVYVPEYLYYKDIISDQEKFDWEWDALHSSGVVLFWVPRQFPELPAMCTNVEFGYYNGIGKKVVYGRPDTADKNGYLDELFAKLYNKKPQNDLKSLLKEAVQIVKE